MFIADDYNGTFTFNNVVFQRGPFGLRLNAYDKDLTVSLKDVYSVEPFEYDPLLFQDVNAHINITQWDNVRYATIVNGELVPGALISPTAPTPAPAPTPDTTPTAPQIASYSTDSGKLGDGITNDNILTLTGSAPASTTVNVFDGTSKVGTAQVNSSGQRSVTTSALSDGFHKLTATDTNSVGKTSAASEAISVTIDVRGRKLPIFTERLFLNTSQNGASEMFCFFYAPCGYGEPEILLSCEGPRLSQRLLIANRAQLPDNSD